MGSRDGPSLNGGGGSEVRSEADDPSLVLQRDFDEWRVLDGGANI